MELTEDGIIENYAISCGYCLRNTFLSYEYEFIWVACG